MKKLLFTILFSSLLLVGFSQSNESIENTIRRLDSLENVSFLNSNLAALDSLWAADMVVNNPQNTISRSSAITRESLKKGIIKHVVQERNIEHLVVKQNMVIVMGNEVIQNKADEPKYKRRFTNIWLKQGNSWKMTVRHANKIADTQMAAMGQKELNTDETMIRQLDSLEAVAFLKNDTAMLINKLWSKDFVVTNPFNNIVTVKDIFALMQTQKITQIPYTRTIEKITFTNNIAFIMGIEIPDVSKAAAGVPKSVTSPRRFTNVWAKTADGWRLSGRQATNIN